MQTSLKPVIISLLEREILMIKKKKYGALIVLSGPSGAGKDTICNAFLKRNDQCFLSISCTSRTPRGEEKDGTHYYFLTREAFEEKISKNELLEYAEYNGNYYGTPKDRIEEKRSKGIHVILEIEVQGALKVKELVPDAIFIFLMPPSMDILKQRLENRGTETKEKVLARFKTAYQEINEMTKYNYVVVNDEVEDAVNKIECILAAEMCRVDRIEDVDLSTREEVLHETLMEN